MRPLEFIRAGAEARKLSGRGEGEAGGWNEIKRGNEKKRE